MRMVFIMRCKTVACVAGLLVVCSAEVFASEWEVRQAMSRATLWSREIAESCRTQFKIEGEAKANMERIIDLFQDISTYPQWFGYCAKARELPTSSEGRYFYYMVIDTPWPIKDRKVVNSVQYEYFDDRTIITFTEASWKKVPYDKSLIRIPYLAGSCEVKEVAQNRCIITFVLALDPGGGLPCSFADSFTEDHLVKIYDGLKRMLE